MAIVFGRESSGLRNSELDRCHHLGRIPVNEEFSSLNLGSAVTVMLYELRKAMSIIDESKIVPKLVDESAFASAEQMQGFYQHMEKVLHQIEFTDGRSSKLMRKIIRLFNRAHPTVEEINMMRGVLASMEYVCKLTGFELNSHKDCFKAIEEDRGWLAANPVGKEA